MDICAGAAETLCVGEPQAGPLGIGGKSEGKLEAPREARRDPPGCQLAWLERRQTPAVPSLAWVEIIHLKRFDLCGKTVDLMCQVEALGTIEMQKVMLGGKLLSQLSVQEAITEVGVLRGCGEANQIGQRLHQLALAKRNAVPGTLSDDPGQGVIRLRRLAADQLLRLKDLDYCLLHLIQCLEDEVVASLRVCLGGQYPKARL